MILSKLMYVMLAIMLVATTASAYYDVGYLNRDGISIVPQSTTLRNIPIVLNATGLDTEGLITAGRLQADCDDILTINQSDNAILPFLWESRNDVNYGCNTKKSIIWYGLDIIGPNPTNQSYFYYNNPSTINTATYSGTDVFKWQGFLYLFGVNGSTTAYNLLDASRNGTISGTSIFYKELIGNALNFTGTQTTGTYVNTSLSDFNKTGNFSIGFWIDYVAQDRTGEGSIIYSHWDGGISTRQHLQLSVSDASNNGKGLREFNVVYHTDDNCNGASIVRNAFNFTNYTRNFIVVTFNESLDVNIYLNGVLNKSYLETNAICGYWQRESAIGKLSYDNIRQLSSTLDFFFIINQSLTAQEVKALYEMTNTSFNSMSPFTEPLYTYTPIYNGSATEGTTQRISLNVTYDTDYFISQQATLYFDGTEYATTQLTTTNSTVFYADIDLGGVSTATSKTFFFNVSLSDGVSPTEFTTSTFSMTVNPVGNINVTSLLCPDRAYYFDFQDEQNFTLLSADVNYIFYYGINNGTSKSIFGNFTNVANFSLCINSTSSPSWTIGYGEIQYYTSGYSDRRYYIFEGTSITNATENITLYNILSSEQTSFKMQLEDVNLNPLTNKYTATYRWYPNLNTYKIVEMGKTDNLGTTVLHVEAENVDYRIGAYQPDGTLLKLSDSSRFLCLVNPCTYVMRVITADQDYFSFFNVDYTFTFNETTKIFRFTYSDRSQRTSTMNLTVYRETGTSSIPVCSSYNTGYIGVLTCNISQYTSGTFRAIVRREASPPIVFVQKIITLISSPLKSQLGLFVTLLIALPVVMIMAYISPIAGIIGMIISLIPALYYGVFGGIGAVIFGCIIGLGFIVIHFIKRGNV